MVAVSNNPELFPMFKFLVIAATAADGVGVEDCDVNVFVKELTADEVATWLKRMETVERTADEDPGLQSFMFNSDGVFYAVGGADDEEGVGEEFVNSLSEGDGYVVLDALPDWWNQYAHEVRSDGDLLYIMKTAVYFDAYEKYGGDTMNVVCSISRDELQAITF
jgi:hypothetical protein